MAMNRLTDEYAKRTIRNVRYVTACTLNVLSSTKFYSSYAGVSLVN